MKLSKFLIILFFILSKNVFATDMSINNTKTKEIKEKKMETLKDFKQLEKDLLKAYTLGDKAKGVILGSLYANDFTLQDSIVVKDIKKANYYLTNALSDGYGLSALLLVSLDEHSTVDEKLLMLERGLKASFTKQSSKVVLAVAFNGFVLDFKSDNSQYVHKALDLTYPVSRLINKSTLDFTIANLLRLTGNIEEANLYLNTACNNPEAEKEIIDACRNSNAIENKR